MIVTIGSYPTFRLCYKSLYINKNPGLNFCFHWTVPRFLRIFVKIWVQAVLYLSHSLHWTILAFVNLQKQTKLK